MSRRNLTPYIVAVTAAAMTVAAMAWTDGTADFDFAQMGQAFSAALFEDDPLVGKQIVAARIVLDVTVYPCEDAADFVTDLLLPIEPDEGGTNVLVLTGADMGWSGDGAFLYEEDTDIFNGVFVARRYGGETYGVQGEVHIGSTIEVTYIDGGGCHVSRSIHPVGSDITTR